MRRATCSSCSTRSRASASFSRRLCHKGELSLKPRSSTILPSTTRLMSMFSISIRVPVGASPSYSPRSWVPPPMVRVTYLVAFGDLLLDAEVEVGRRGCLLSYRSLVTFYADFFPSTKVVAYEGRSQQFVSC